MGGTPRGNAGWNGRLRALAALGAMLVGASTNGPARADAPSPPEDISGSFGDGSVVPRADGATGAMIYAVPFVLPRARGVAQPSLGLTYRSSARTGEAGEGWSLGLPAIERAPLSGWPRYADTDGAEERYAYGGQPLTFICVVGGAPACPSSAGTMPGWAEGHRHYRLQVDKAQDRFFLEPNRTRFVVQRRGGEILELGQPLTRADLTGPATDTDIGTGRVFRWNLSRQYDLHGIENGTLGGGKNLIVYDWTPPMSGRRYLADIYYTPPAASPTTAALSDFAYHVQLGWEHPDYIQHHYTHVDKRRHELRLRRAAVASKTWTAEGERELVRAYTLGYYAPRGIAPVTGEAPLWNRSFLREVRQEGRCGVVEIDGRIPEPAGCPLLPPQTFEYQRAVLATGTATRSPLNAGPGAPAGYALPYPGNTAVVDIDRDGRPDVLQGWPQQVDLNSSVSSYTDCAASSPGDADWFIVKERDFVVGESQPFDPQLVCKYGGFVRSAREQTAYFGRGPLGAGTASFVHHCVDAGDGHDGTLTKWQFTPPMLASPAALFSSWGAEVFGPWGDALLFWTKADNHGFALESASTDPAATREKYCPNARNGDALHPSLRWRETADSLWAKRPAASVLGGTFVDIDGDGYPDRLSAGTETLGDFRDATVSLARRISAMENVDGIAGPALIPTTWSPEAEASMLPIGAGGLAEESQYVDVNGDGLVDLVSFKQTDSEMPRVRPGNGRGHFGCLSALAPGDPSCVVTGNGSWMGDAYRLSIADGPDPRPLVRWDSSWGKYLRRSFFRDVTGDGLADLVVYEPSHGPGATDGRIQLWVNTNGHSFRCAALPDCVVATLTGLDQPDGGLLSSRISFADIDANGTEDIVILGNDAMWHFSFVQTAPMSWSTPRAPRPGLLTRIRNGVGADTEITYQTIQELDVEAESGDPVSFDRPWASHVPVVLPVVTRIRVRDTKGAGGGAPLTEPFRLDRTTTISYRDPAYDLWERAFKGFRRVLVEHPTGDATQTWYWFGDCETGAVSLSCALTSDDSPDKAFVGLAARVDHFVPGIEARPDQWLSTTIVRYGDSSVPSSGGDRSAHSPLPVAVHEYLYDTSTIVNRIDEIRRPDQTQIAPSQPGKRVEIVTETIYDSQGSIARVTRKGARQEGGAFLDAELITTIQPELVPRCEGDWACLPREMRVSERRPGMSQPETLRRTTFGWNEAADLTTLASDLRYPYAGNPAHLDRSVLGTAAPATASTAPGLRTLRSFTVDPFGNVTKVRGPVATNQSCTDAYPDRTYAQFPEAVVQYAGGSCTGTALMTQLRFDRGLQLPSATMDASGAITTSDYDEFGRLHEVYAPAAELGLTDLVLRLTHVSSAPLSWVKIERRVDVDAFINSYAISNGIGEPVLNYDQADTAADGAPWITHGWTERDDSGRVLAIVRPWKTWTNPEAVAAAAPTLSPGAGRHTLQRDAFGRPMFVYDGALITAEYTHRPLEVDVKDAEQRNSASPHFGLFTTVKQDGHGRVVEKDVRYRDASGTHMTSTRVSFLGTGEPIEIVRSSGTESYQRSLQWDSFGRLVANDEPNTSRAEVVDENGSPTTYFRMWRYVYDNEGRLVGTSDARGCGKNLHYDALGRLLAEDYSRCDSSQPEYTAPNLTTGDGTEAFYRYDTYEPGQVAPTPEFGDTEMLAMGRLVSIQDRGAHTRFNYDARGALRRQTRRIVRPGAPAELLANRYAAHWFEEASDFDIGGRLRARRTKLELDDLLVNGVSQESFAYSARGLLRTVASSYGTLASDLRYLPNGALSHVTYGDAASTYADMTYDARDRVASYHLRRPGPATVWSQSTANYPAPGGETTQLDLAHYTFGYDAVGNPRTIDDVSTSSWPGGSVPLSRYNDYDDHYRLKTTYYYHGVDEQVSPYFAELQSGDRRPVPDASIGSRVMGQTFAFDWQGNTVSSADNLGIRYDRSLGAVTNGRVVGGQMEGPNQLVDADGIHADYDAAGNMRELTVARTWCRPEAPDCSHRFVYEWDEVGQLARARRWDYPGGAVPALDPAAPPVWEMDYAYSGGMRVRKSSKDAFGAEEHTLDVFGTLRIRNSRFLESIEDYTIRPNEVRFLHGGARVFFDRSYMMPMADDSPVHVFLPLGDHLGSTAFVLDKASGEVVERTTHQAFGAVESDYRPERWASPRAEHKFTGKEEDIEVGLTYFGARYYQPYLGRWASADPLTIHGLGADLNPYAYVSGRVMSHVDPFGLQGEPMQEVCICHKKPTFDPDLVAARTGALNPPAGAPWASATGSAFAGYVGQMGLRMGEALRNAGKDAVLGTLASLYKHLGLSTPFGDPFGVEDQLASRMTPASERGVDYYSASVAIAVLGGELSGPSEASLLGEGMLGRGGAAAEGAAGEGFTTFLHGASTASAENIAGGGLRAVSTNTGAYPAGSFFTHEASQPLSQVAASHWPVVSGKAASTGVGVVGMRVPNSLLGTLRGAGLVRTGAVPGVAGFPAETVFLPEAFPALNKNATFFLLPPTF